MKAETFTWSYPYATGKVTSVEVYRHTFDSWQSFVSHCEKHSHMVGSLSHSWLHATVEEITDMAENGWEEGIKEALPLARAAVAHIEQNALVERAEATWDVTGCEVDMGRYMSGTPECMIEYEPFQISTVGRVVTLVASIGALALYTTEQMLRKGAAVVALAIALEETQHSVEIWLDSTVARDHTARRYLGSTRVLLKGATDRLDAKTIALALGHPSTLRYWVFADRWSFPSEWRNRLDIASGSMGCSQDPIEDKVEGTIYMPSLNQDRNVPDPERFVMEQLGKLGLLR